MPTETRHPKASREPKPNPDCQSLVEGYVVNLAGQRVAGATVTIEGPDWSNGIMTDDGGHYGFGGLCAGTVTLQAALPNGRNTSPATANLDGQSSVHIDLSVSPAGVTGTTLPVATTAAAQQTPTPTPEMPTTGYANWLLVGGALLGLLLLLSAGARRAFGHKP
jgi:hypothetical protein